ncbi:MAG TPA: group III truncated hemoglobin [Thermoanaerobaculia bacterium]|nr:group III truncated hemoglobin [Thermoanaerobaculia bacterium]
MNVFELRARVSEEQIRLLVHRFYRQVRADQLLAPVFAARIAEPAWPGHLEKLCDFWSTALLGTARYRRNPLAPHLELPGLTGAHFDRWLELFRATLDDVFPQDIARAIHSRATRMGRHLESACVRP